MIAGASAPAFLLALLGILWLSGGVHWLPATGDTGYTNPPTGPTGMIVVDGLLHGEPSVAWDGFVHLLLPAFCIALGPAVSIGRVLRGSLVNAMRSDFVRTARAKGLTEREVLFRHAFRNALTAPLAMTGLQAGLMFAGVVVIETVFAWPGIGLVHRREHPGRRLPRYRRRHPGAGSRLCGHQHASSTSCRRSPTRGSSSNDRTQMIVLK